MARHRHLTVAQPEEHTCGKADAVAFAGCSDGSHASEAGDVELLQVGDLAKAVGKTVRAIHLYEDMGLLKPNERSPKGRYRLFGKEALLRARWIIKLQSLGLSLSKIQELVKDQEDAESASFAASKLSQVYVDKLAETRAKIRELQTLEKELQASLTYLNTCDSACEPELPVDSCSACNRHPSDEHAPVLVAGLRVH